MGETVPPITRTMAANNSATRASGPRLPSCQQCRHRKVKCDGHRPKCASCLKYQVECEFVDSTTGQVFSGQYIQQLEQEEQNLQQLVEAKSPVDGPLDSLDFPGQGELSKPNITDTPTPGNVQAGGISFLRLLFADSDWRQRNVDLLQKFAERPQIIETKSAPHPLPKMAEAKVLVERYLSGTHVQNPFLLRQDVEMTFQRIYSSESMGDHAKHDLFCIFMILAIGSIVPFRNGQHDKHPFGYFLSALSFFDQDFLVAGLQGIQDLVLIARFGIYYHIGTSIWEIAQICIRMCIELGFHRKATTHISCLQEQIQRIIFWHCYIIDRYSSTTLGRPFAIADQEITVPFPKRVNDEDLAQFHGFLDEVQDRADVNDMSIFLFYVELRQITSRMHKFFSKIGKPTSPNTSPLLVNGRIHIQLHKFLQELSEWRLSAPIFPEPTCLYHRPEWRDFMYERYRLLLLRSAVDAIPKQNGQPPRELIEMIAESSTELIYLYAGLYDKRQITYTRSYFQMLFTGGLSLLFAISSLSHQGEFKLQSRSTTALQKCEDLLKQISLQLQDSNYYTAIFEALHRETIRRSSFVYHQFLTSSAPTRRGSQSGIEFPDQQHLNDFHQYHPQVPQMQLDRPVNEGAAQFPPQCLGGQRSAEIPGNSVNDMNATQNPPFPNIDQYGNLPQFYPSTENETMEWGGFSNDWLSMEAGLVEYAYGDPYSDFGIWDQLHVDLNDVQV